MPKRPLTTEELRAAAALAAAIEASAKSQEVIGDEVGVSQGMIWQWANGRLPVPAGRAQALADAVGIKDVGSISVAWRNLFREMAVSGAVPGKPAAVSGAITRGQEDPARFAGATPRHIAALQRIYASVRDEDKLLKLAQAVEALAGGSSLTPPKIPFSVRLAAKAGLYDQAPPQIREAVDLMLDPANAGKAKKVATIVMKTYGHA